MSGVNEQDVLDQLASFGLDVTGKYEIGKPCRCHWSGEDRRNNKGWFWLNEKVFDDGNVYVIGGYGVWHGDDNNRQSVKINGDYKPSKQDQAMMRQNLADQRKQAAAQAKRKQAKAAEEAARRWRDLSVEMPTTDSDEPNYQQRKQIKAYGVRYDLIGMIAVPVADVSGKKHGLQWMMDRKNPLHRPEIDRLNGTDKQFWPKGMAISGNFHLIGVPDQRGIILLAEGYATAASLHEASGLPVAVTFNANNIAPVLKNLKGHYKRARFLIAADDDYLCRCSACKKQTPVAIDGKIAPCQHCGEAHKKNNTGIRCATNACADVRGAEWFIPQFTARDGRKITDFNDLHVEEGLNAVASQVDAAIADKFPDLGDSEASPAREAQTGGEGKSAEPSYMTIDDAVVRYSLIYGPKDTMFDHHAFMLVPKSCVMDNTPDRAWGEMKKHPDFKRYRLEAVGFDPTGTDEKVLCNLWGGWPTEPDSRCSCDKLLELLAYLCSEEKNTREVHQWLLKWLAYPIQHPGVKMKTAIVMHGPTRVGKNLFFEAVMDIYGEYGRMIGNAELEDKFNEWASRRLFLIANEVNARQEMFHQKNKIKGLVTDAPLTINPKNVAQHHETNHMNIVFLSNESMPVVPDSDDERFTVIWTPKRKEKPYYADIYKELAAGGVKALHYYLKHEVDLGDFYPGTPPPMTESKRDLIELAKEAPERFVDAWRNDELDVPFTACASADIYECYRKWSLEQGERFSYAHVKFSAALKRMDDIVIVKQYILLQNGKQKRINAVITGDFEDRRVSEGATKIESLSKAVREFRAAMDVSL